MKRVILSIIALILFAGVCAAGEKKKRHLHNLFHKKPAPAKVEPAKPGTTKPAPNVKVSVGGCPNCVK